MLKRTGNDFMVHQAKNPFERGVNEEEKDKGGSQGLCHLNCRTDSRRCQS